MTDAEVAQWIADERQARKSHPGSALVWELLVALRIPYIVNWLNGKHWR